MPTLIPGFFMAIVVLSDSVSEVDGGSEESLPKFIPGLFVAIVVLSDFVSEVVGVSEEMEFFEEVEVFDKADVFNEDDVCIEGSMLSITCENQVILRITNIKIINIW